MPKISLMNTVVVVSIMLLGFGVAFFGTHTQNVQPLKPLSTFPKQIGKWSGQESRFDQTIYDALGVDDSFLATYYNKKGHLVQLYIGYYEKQRKGDLIHSPKNCMPGAGWNIADSSFAFLDTGNGKKVKVIKMRLENVPNAQIMLYWFHSRGRIISSEYMQKIYLVTDSIFRNRTDGSFIRLLAPVNQKDQTSAVEDLKNFAEKLLPILYQYLPN